MNVYTTDKIRNVVLLGHGGCGKTSLVEAMAYLSGKITRMGKVEDGKTISDYDKEDEKINYFQKSNEKMYKDNKDEIEKQQLDVNNNFKYIISHSAIILFVLIVICLILFRKKNIFN